MGGVGRVPPDIFQQAIFADLPGKEGPGRKGKWRGKGGKFEGKTWKLKKEGKSMKLFVCLFVYFFPCHFFETTQFCLGCSIFHAGENREK